MNILIVEARYHLHVAQLLLDGATAALEKGGAHFERVSMPGVLEVAAVGVPDEHSGESVKVFIVKKDPALTAEQVRAFCHENLTGYKRPKAIEFRTELPKSNVGKILRKELRTPSRN